jgi:arsenate reductase
VITVCDNARETCPYFPGEVKNQLHMGFDDPAVIRGSDDFIRQEFIRVRDEIKTEFFKFYTEEIRSRMKKQNR